MRRLPLLTLAAVFLLLPGLGQTKTASSVSSVTCERAVSWSTASRFVGRYVAIRGRVAGGYHASSSNGEPTFLNLGFDYPNPRRFTIVIWQEDRAKFGAPERRLRGRTICVTGRVSEYDGVPQIVVRSPSQIRLM